MQREIDEIFMNFGWRPRALITRYVAHYAITAIEHALNDRRGHIGTVPGDLRAIIRNCTEERIVDKTDGITEIKSTVAGFDHSFSNSAMMLYNLHATYTEYVKYGVLHREHGPCIIDKCNDLSTIELKWAMFGEYHRDHNMPQKVTWSRNTCFASWEQAVGDGYTTCGTTPNAYIQRYPKTLRPPGKIMGTVVQHIFIADQPQVIVVPLFEPYELRHYLYPNRSKRSI